ncbi:MAG: 2OG-Fe(II) oxygenase [Blastocatellia bacterium]|nr:2OG-Fe(II) oxygenase [Blastocatellia bacterium]
MSLERDLPALRSDWHEAVPYPHITIDGFLIEQAAELLLTSFEKLRNSESWISYNHYNEKKKSGMTRMELMDAHAQAVIAELSSPRFLNWLERLSNIKGLLADPDLDGGGFHEIKRDGFLNMHVDFQSHTRRKSWSRQINLLLYLNHDWQDEWEGFLELWDSRVKTQAKRIKPIFNRMVLFQTSARNSFHGHPIPLKCPRDRSRKSLAQYYFRDEGKTLRLEPTYYKARPDESKMKHALVAVDRFVLQCYSFLKRHKLINDRIISRVLKRFS